MIAVVDTNVLMIANKKNKAASPGCTRVCADKLIEIVSSGKVVLDDGWLILHEYGKHLNPSGQPGFGDFFYKWVLTNRKNPQHCELVKITPIPSDIENFLEFPGDEKFEDFDPSDRKFIAVSISHQQHPPILFLMMISLRPSKTNLMSMWLSFLQMRGMIVDYWGLDFKIR